jgi:hypothetical protein
MDPGSLSEDSEAKQRASILEAMEDAPLEMRWSELTYKGRRRSQRCKSPITAFVERDY